MAEMAEMADVSARGRNERHPERKEVIKKKKPKNFLRFDIAATGLIRLDLQKKAHCLATFIY